VVSGGAPVAGDGIGHGVELDLPGGWFFPGDEAKVQGGSPAGAGDFEHVVVLRVDVMLGDILGTVADVGDVVLQLRGRLDGDRLHGWLPVTGSRGDLGRG